MPPISWKRPERPCAMHRILHRHRAPVRWRPSRSTRPKKASSRQRKGLHEANDAIDDLVDSQREQEENQAEEQDLADEQAAIPDIKGEPITVDEIAISRRD